MAQKIESLFICDGRYRVHTVDAIGGRSARIVEIEDVDTRQRYWGSSGELRRLLDRLCRRHAEESSLSA